MALETGTYISDLNSSNPVATDGLAQADDHIRLVKSTIKATLPNITGAITGTQDELNTLDGYTGNTADLNILSGAAAAGVTGTELGYVNGVTSALQTQLNSLSSGKASTGTSISAGGGLTGGGSLAANRTISHSDTSAQGSVNNSGNTVIQDISVDTYGHVTGIGSTALSIPTGNTLSTSSNRWTDGSGGLQIHWGSFTSTEDDDQTVNFSTPFSNACLFCVVAAEFMVEAVTRTNFRVNRDNGYNGSFTVTYMAIGY